MYAKHQPLAVHEPLLVCPSCETAMLCKTNREVRAESEVTVLLCPSCGVYHSMNNSSPQRILYATPVSA